MSDPVSKAEIEDVLSSIRRLVSDEPDVLHRRRKARSAEQDRLVLTPAQRVTGQQDAPETDAAENGDWQAEPGEVPDLSAIAQLGDRQPAAEPEPGAPQDPATSASMTLEDRIAGLEAALASSGDEWEPDGSETGESDETRPLSADTGADFAEAWEREEAELAAARADDAAQGAGADAARDPHTGDALAEEPGGIAADPGDHALGPRADGQDDAADAETGGPATTPVPEDDTEAETDTAAQPAPEPEPVAAEPDGAADAEASEPQPSEAAQDDADHAAQTDAAPPADGAPDTPAADDDALSAAFENGALDWEEWDPATETAPAPDEEKAGPRIAEARGEDRHDAEPAENAIGDMPPEADDVEEDGFNLYAEEETLIDEEALRDLVAGFVREELQGVLGERITRNVRRLVRREIERALAMRDLK